jgi:uncharacterized protein with FMN-binding domain
MNRSPVIIAATIAGLALVLSFKPTVQATAATNTNAAALTTGNANVAGAQTVVGSDQQLNGGLGDIQVKVTAANGKIVSVGMARMNLHGPQSAQISNNVIPQLEQQAMAGGAIHAVSGATYTSRAFATSLQNALSQLGGNNASLATHNGNGSFVQPAHHDD